MVSRTELSTKSSGSGCRRNFRDQSKISSIVEMFQARADEASSALLACRMGKTLATERLLFGALRTSGWEEVSRKRKRTSFRFVLEWYREIGKHNREMSKASMKQGFLT